MMLHRNNNIDREKSSSQSKLADRQKMRLLPISLSLSLSVSTWQQVSFKPQNYLQSAASKLLDTASDGNSISALIINFFLLPKCARLAMLCCAQAFASHLCTQHVSTKTLATQNISQTKQYNFFHTENDQRVNLPQDSE